MKRKHEAEQTLENVAGPVAENNMIKYAIEEPETSMRCPHLCKSVSDRRTKENITSLHVETETPRTGTIMTSRQADFEIGKIIDGRIENDPDASSKMIVTIVNEIYKEGGGLANLSRTLVDNPISNGQMGQPHINMDRLKTDCKNTQKKRQVRGPTRCLKLLTTVGRIKIVTNELGQPVGSEAAQLTSFLGITARDGNLAPLTYPSWSKMPKENKENMWQKVLAKFDIDPSCRSWVLMSLRSKWRSFKSHLKTTHYDTHATDEERFVDCDERVLPDQWSFLVSQWSSDKFQSLSAKNKASRAKVRFNHTSGTKSYARIREEEKTKRPYGQKPSQEELFSLTFTPKNGQPVNDAAAAAISPLHESSTQKEETSTINYKYLHDDSNQVMGVDRNGGGSEFHTQAEVLRMVKEKNAEVLEMKEKLASVEQTCSLMAAQMSAMMSMMATMHKGSSAANSPNAAAGTFVSVGMPIRAEPISICNHEVCAKQTCGRKKRR